MNMHKVLGVFVFLFVAFAAFSMVASANVVTTCDTPGFRITSIELNNNDVNFDRGTETVKINDELDVEIEWEEFGRRSYDNVRVRAYLESEDVRVSDQDDASDVFDVMGSSSGVVDLSIPVSYRSEKSDSRTDRFWLNVQFDSFDGRPTLCEHFRVALSLDADNNEVRIDKVFLTPADVVQAGTPLYVEVRVDNIGDNDQEKGVTMEASIAGIPGARAFATVEELDDGELVTAEPMFIQIPACTPAGNYNVDISVEYRYGSEVVTTTVPVQVIESGACPLNAGNDNSNNNNNVPETVVVASTAPQNVYVGGQAGFYPVTITNNGKSAKTFVLTVEGYSSFATATVNPSSVVVVQPGQTAMTQVALSGVETATAGTHPFTVSIRSADGSFAQSLPLTANVVVSEKSSNGGLSGALEIVLIVLLVIIVILALVIGFSRLKGDNDDFDEDNDQTYY